MSPFLSGLSMLVSKCGKALPTLPCLVPGPGRLEDWGPVVSVEPSSSMMGRSREAKYCCVLRDSGEAPEKRPPSVG